MLTPRAGECLGCFVASQLDEFGCSNTLRFVPIYRDHTAPRETALLKRLSSAGGYCDCEIFMNAYTLSDRYLTPEYWSTNAQGYDEWEEPQPPEQWPSCKLVRRGSTQPCEVWQRKHRGYDYW